MNTYLFDPGGDGPPALCRKPFRTRCARCYRVAGLLRPGDGPRSQLVDAVARETMPDGTLRVALAPHDCDRARDAARTARDLLLRILARGEARERREGGGPCR